MIETVSKNPVTPEMVAEMIRKIDEQGESK